VKVRREAVEEYLNRDWALFEESEADHWRATKRTLGEGYAVLLADRLRREVAARRPDWPDEEERASDLVHHVRLAELLRRAAPSRRR
jgi:hypothetical protein